MMPLPMGQRKLLKAAIREFVNQSPAVREDQAQYPEEGPPEMQPGEGAYSSPVTPAGSGGILNY